MDEDSGEEGPVETAQVRRAANASSAASSAMSNTSSMPQARATPQRLTPPSVWLLCMPVSP